MQLGRYAMKSISVVMKPLTRSIVINRVISSFNSLTLATHLTELLHNRKIELLSLITGTRLVVSVKNNRVLQRYIRV